MHEMFLELSLNLETYTSMYLILDFKYYLIYYIIWVMSIMKYIHILVILDFSSFYHFFNNYPS